MNFNTQICTTREQSKRLLALGLKKETADCFIWKCDGKDYHALNSPDAAIDESKGDIVAWSLHRLIAMYCNGFYAIQYDLVGLSYDGLIFHIEAMIKCERFNKEYLEE